MCEGIALLDLIVFSIAKAVPTTLLFYGVVYLSLRKKMVSRSVVRSLASFMLTLLACGLLNYALGTIIQDPNDVVAEQYMNIASVIAPFFISAAIVWIVHIGLIRKRA